MDENKPQADELLSGPESDLARAANDVRLMALERRHEATVDPQPRFLDIDIYILGGRMRLRRLQPEQLLTLHDNCQAACLYDLEQELTSDTRDVMAKAIQVGLCPTDTASLLLPGPLGRARIRKLPDKELLRCFTEVVTFNDLPLGIRPDGNST